MSESAMSKLLLGCIGVLAENTFFGCGSLTCQHFSVQFRGFWKSLTSGTDTGKFSNSTDDGIAVNGIFIGGVNSGNIAPVEIFNCRTNA